MQSPRLHVMRALEQILILIKRLSFAIRKKRWGYKGKTADCEGERAGVGTRVSCVDGCPSAEQTRSRTFLKKEEV